MILKKIKPACEDWGDVLDAFVNIWKLDFDTNYACWCGKGTVNAEKKKPRNVLDRICRAHDICYDTIYSRGCPEPYDLKYSWDWKKNDNKKVKKH